MRLLLIALLLVTGCATRSTTGQFTEFEPPPTPVWGFVPGDSFVITFQNSVDLPPNSPTEVAVAVNSDGCIELPEIGRVRVLGLTPVQVECMIRAEFRKRGVLPLTVPEPDCDRATFQVQGEVNAPGRYLYFPGMRLSHAISSSGGLSDRANPRKVTILRKDGSTLRYDYRQIRKWPENDPAIRPDDIIDVKPKLFAVSP